MHLPILRGNSVCRGYERQTATQFSKNPTKCVVVEAASVESKSASSFSSERTNLASNSGQMPVFLSRGLSHFSCKDEHFSNRRAALDENQIQEQTGSLNSQWQNSRE
jgi:hypothetical protein